MRRPRGTGGLADAPSSQIWVNKDHVVSITVKIVQEDPRSRRWRESVAGRTAALKAENRLSLAVTRKSFQWKLDKKYLLPVALTGRLQSKEVSDYLAGASLALSHRPPFNIPLDLHIGTPLRVTVKEFRPLEATCEVRHAFHSIQGSDGTRIFGRQKHWNPPIIMLIGEGETNKVANNMQKKLVDIFDQVVDDPAKFTDWTIQYFEDREEDFQTTILDLIREYYQKDVEEHAILRTCLKLLWWEYLLIHKFTVPPEGVAHLKANLGSDRSIPAHGDMHVIPDTINRYLKAIILPLAEGAAKEVAENLHAMLFKMAFSPKQSRATTDVALCLHFGLMIYLGRTHNALLLVAQTPPHETGEHYTVAKAKSNIRGMEDKVSDYFLSFHKFALSRRDKAPMTSAEASSPMELHARQFDLVGRLFNVVIPEYESERLENLTAVDFPMGTFRYMNVRRLCWKLMTVIEDSRLTDAGYG